MITPYPTPTGEFYAETEVKRSRFIAVVKPISSLKDMRELFLDKRAEHPKARHNCWGVIAGSPTGSNLYGFSDDGEPNGCAGKPIFSILGYSGIGQIGLIVTRYFGGIKLGTGGMVKAYTSAAQSVLEITKTIQFSPKVTIVCNFAYDKESHFRHFLETQPISSAEFFYNTAVELKLTLNEIDLEKLKIDIITLFGVTVGIK